MWAEADEHQAGVPDHVRGGIARRRQGPQEGHQDLEGPRSGVHPARLGIPE